MTDETYARILDHARRNVFPLSIYVDAGIPPDEPELAESIIRLCMADYSDLRRRVDRENLRDRLPGLA